MFSNTNCSNFINQVSKTDFAIDENDDIDFQFDLFYNKLFEIYNGSFPIKKKRLKGNLVNQPWVTLRLKKCIKKKYKLYNLLKRGLIQRRFFTRYKNLLNWVTEKMRRRYFYNKFLSSNGDLKQTWKNINNVLSRKTKSNIGEIVDDNHTLLQGQHMVQCFNNYFCNIASDLVSDLPAENDYRLIDNSLNTINNSCFLFPTNPVEVNDILLKLPNKGNPIFEIRPKILYHVSLVLVPIICKFYNLCISKGVYPSALKKARVVPVYKSGEKNKVNNYRPISNLSSINKIFEILTYNRLNSFINKNDILVKNQFGFRENSNTSLAIFTLMSDFIQTLNDESYTIALFVDLRKAFDVVNRDILLNKLRCYGFRGVSWNFLSSYLSNRSQYVVVDNFKSSILSSNWGVPQGSVLGPLLFIIFINDLVNIGKCKLILFADDAVIYVNSKDFLDCIDRINAIISNLSSWLKLNKLILNTSKTKLMLVTSHLYQNLPDITFNGVVIDWVSQMKYLGLNIDAKLNFNFHVNELCKQLSKYRGVVYSLSKSVPQNILIKIYHSLIYPQIINNIIIWGGTNITNRDKIAPQ